jgi:hypothetical protein
MAAPRIANAGVTLGVRPITQSAPEPYAVWIESPGRRRLMEPDRPGDVVVVQRQTEDGQ